MARAFRSISEPQPNRVYQRSADDTAVIAVRGELADGAGGVVEARVTGRKGDAVTNWLVLSANGASFAGEIPGVPTGGPYRVELRVVKGGEVVASRAVSGVLVGDLWILAGQSNMDGCGKLINLEPPSPHVHCYYYDETWGIARDPLCWVLTSIDPVHWPPEFSEPGKRAAVIEYERAFRDWGASLGVRFGKDLYKATGVPVGVIACSHGGTSMAQWDPSLKDQGGNSLYGSMMRRVAVCGGKVKGCLWYQGESDALGPGRPTYRRDTIAFVEALRKDLNEPDLPFIYAQLGPVLANLFGMSDQEVNEAWNDVQNEQLAMEMNIPNSAFAAAVDSTMSDFIHLDAISQRRMGARMAKLARRLAFGHDIEVGPRPVTIEYVNSARAKIRVGFDGVNGGLAPERGIRGFQVEKDNVPMPITSCVLDSQASVVISLASPVPAGARLWYGRGIIPVCNLADREGFPAPVFGPVALP